MIDRSPLPVHIHDQRQCTCGPDCAACAELAIIEAEPVPPDPADYGLTALSDRNPCRGGACPASPCDNCRAWWTWCRVVAHRRRRVHADRQRLAPSLADLRRIAEVYPDALTEILTPIIVPVAALVAREVTRGS